VGSLTDEAFRFVRSVVIRTAVPTVVLLRGANMIGKRLFRPAALARELSDLEVVSNGAAGTFVLARA
jgi:hypothetical protein